MCGLIALYAHLVGFSKSAHLQGKQHAKDLIKKYNPDKRITTLKLSDDERAALAVFSDGTASLLYHLGRRWVTHSLVNDSIKKLRVLRNGRLQISFPDFTAPSMTLHIGENTAPEPWLFALQPFVRTSAAPLGV